jgi:hypothetical protein
MIGLFPTHCWLPDCQGSLLKETFFDPISFTVPCPDICAVLSSGLNVEIGVLNANVADIGNTVIDCDFGQYYQLKTSPMNPMDPCTGQSSLTQLEYEVKPNTGVYTTEVSVQNLAVDITGRTYPSMTLSVLSGDLFPFVRVHNLPDDGKNSATVGLGPLAVGTFGLSIDTNYSIQEGDYFSNIHVTDSTGANEPIPVDVQIFVRNTPQTSQNCTVGTLSGLICCDSSSESASAIRLHERPRSGPCSYDQSYDWYFLFLVIVFAIAIALWC